VPWPILVVEDDDELRDALSDMLAAHGYRLHTAADGQEALRLLTRKTIRPALIILDVMMPVMDGLTLLDKLGEDPSLATIPVVVLSAQSQHGTAFPTSVVGVLGKPLELPELLEVVRVACGKIKA
jgi:CheY-like chemotaxis protein